MRKQFPSAIYCILLSLLFVTFITGCQDEPAPARPFQAPEAESPTPSGMGQLPPLPEAGPPDAMIRVFRQTAESLGMRDESDPKTNTYLYFDEETTLLFRLSIHGIDPEFLPKSREIEERVTEDDDTVIELTLHVDETVWIEAISVLPGAVSLPEDTKDKTKNRMRAIQREFKAQMEQD